MKSKLFLLVGFLAAVPASGSLVFTLTPATLTGLPGVNPLVFQGTLTDTDTDNSFLFLNDIRVTFTAPAGSFLSVDPTGQPASTPNAFFFNTVPGTLEGDDIATDDSYVGPIFEVFIAPNTPSAHYFGSIDILGGFNGPDDTNVLATQSFEVDVVAPEPGTMALTLSCLLGAGLGLRRMKRTAA